jgi:YggT family protein
MALHWYMTALDVLQSVLFYLAIAAALVALVDWAIRTRRINPFGGIARFFRRFVDPLLVPVERMVVRAGGKPASAPWWALAAVVVGGILLLNVLQFLGSLMIQLAVATTSPKDAPRILIGWAFSLLLLALIVRVLSSWLPVSPYRWYIRWSYTMTEWFLGPLRRVLPPFGMIDLSPIVAYFAIVILRGLFT